MSTLVGTRRALIDSSGSPPLKVGLVSWWTLEELSGTRFDSFGANNLTDINTVTQNPGKKGNAAQFTAANSERLNIADNAALSSGDVDFTWAAWVYLDSTADQTMLTKGKSGEDEYYLEFVNSLLRFRFNIFTGVGGYKRATANTFGAPATATWCFVIGWHDSAADTVNIQVNGGGVDSTATGGAAPSDLTGAFDIGAYRGAGPFMNGRIDEVAFWKRTLTATEKTWLYNNGNGRTFSDLR